MASQKNMKKSYQSLIGKNRAAKELAETDYNIMYQSLIGKNRGVKYDDLNEGIRVSIPYKEK